MIIIWITLLKAIAVLSFASKLDKTSHTKTAKASSDITACDLSAKYRTFDGSCNNIVHATWGSANSCYRRLLPAYYKGRSGFRESVRGGDLPQARELSLSVHRKINPDNDKTSQMPIYFGQFLMHELSFALPECEMPSCPPNSPSVLCIPMVTQKNCSTFIRSAACHTSSTGKKVRKRDQVTQVTSFIDGSVLYGNSEAEVKALRTDDDTGKMRLHHTHFGHFMPKNHKVDSYCTASSKYCFTGGDKRVNQHAMLSTLQTVFLRDHNKVAKKLRKINPHWMGDRLYQETRRIIGAKLQVIVYNEYVPVIMRPVSIARSKLQVGQNTAYDATVDPTVINEFSTAIARIGHSRMWSDKSKCKVPNSLRQKIPISDLHPYHVGEGFMEDLIKCVTYHKPKGCSDRSMENLHAYSYWLPGIPNRLDIEVLDIVRGRDHGMPPYVEVVKYCGDGKPIRHFGDLRHLIPDDKMKVLKSKYKDVRDIDLIIGLLSEETPEGTVLSITAECIQEIVFRNLKYGDRFYFEHRGEAGSFTQGQLRELRKVTLAKTICRNTDLTKIMPIALQRESESNKLAKCEDLPDMDLSQWKTKD